MLDEGRKGKPTKLHISGLHFIVRMSSNNMASLSAFRKIERSAGMLTSGAAGMSTPDNVASVPEKGGSQLFSIHPARSHQIIPVEREHRVWEHEV